MGVGVGVGEQIRGDGVYVVTAERWRLANDQQPTFYLQVTQPPSRGHKTLDLALGQVVAARRVITVDQQMVSLVSKGRRTDVCVVCGGWLQRKDVTKITPYVIWQWKTPKKLAVRHTDANEHCLVSSPQSQ